MRIRVADEDRSFLKMLYSSSDDPNQVEVLAGTRHLFGLTSSPFVATATIQHHVDVLPASELVRNLIHHDTLVDDFLKSSDDKAELMQIRTDVRTTFSAMGMRVHKFSSNSPELLEGLNQEDIARSVAIGDLEFQDRDDMPVPDVKALGMMWFPTEDELTFSWYPLEKDGIWTLRRISSTSRRLFDPLGLISPVTIRTRLLVQACWIYGLGWDDQIDGEILVL